MDKNSRTKKKSVTNKPATNKPTAEKPTAKARASITGTPSTAGIAKFTTAQQAAWTGFVRAQQSVLGKVDESLKEAGFPPLVWYDVLLALERADGGKLRPSGIGEWMLLKKFNVTRLLDRMEEKGLVSRERYPADKRGVWVTITAKGKKLRSKMWPVYHHAVKEHFLKHFTPTQMRQFGEAFKILLSKPDGGRK